MNKSFSAYMATNRGKFRKNIIDYLGKLDSLENIICLNWKQMADKNFNFEAECILYKPIISNPGTKCK